MKQHDDKNIIEVVLAAVKEVDGKKKMPCAEAFRLAAELGVQPGVVGRICNERDIKIVACQLGCFR